MSKFNKMIVIILSCFFVTVTGILIGFSAISQRNLLSKPNIQNDVSEISDKESNSSAKTENNSRKIKNELAQSGSQDESNENDPAVTEIPKPQKRISEDTSIIYEYYYTEDGRIDVTEEDSPYFLLGKTEKDLGDLFTEWQIRDFDDDRVIMRKTVEGKSNQYYIIGIQDGYVAIFYKNEVNCNNLKEITDTAVSILPIEEQQKLLKGIEVNGEENLVKILEDYGS